MLPQTGGNIIELQPICVFTINEDILSENNLLDVSQDGKL